MKRLHEAQPQQRQNLPPKPPKPPKPAGSSEADVGSIITVTDSEGRAHKARVLGYHGEENGFELEMEGEHPYPKILSARLAKMGWQVPPIRVKDARQSELARLMNRVRREPSPTTESARRLVDRLLA